MDVECTKAGHLKRDDMGVKRVSNGRKTDLLYFTVTIEPYG